MHKPTVYLPNLHFLRFLAASAVLVSHIEYNKLNLGLLNNFHSPISLGGKLGVILFFVLSGFLITFLLLVEQKETRQIDVMAFYRRRALSIWPLYYLTILLGLFVFPHFPLFSRTAKTVSTTHQLIAVVILLVLFLPNLLGAVSQPLTFISGTWSIGTEEQFYLFWPWLMRSRFNKYALLLSVIAVYEAVKIFLLLSQTFLFKGIISGFWDLFRIDCLAVGGLFALLAFKKEQRILKWLYLPVLQWPLYTLTAVMLFRGSLAWSDFVCEVYAILFGYIILNLATNPKRVMHLEFRVTNYLGKISYGLYMYHTAVIIGVTCVLTRSNAINKNWLMYLLCFLFTILIAAFSYEVYEKRFLKSKTKYSRIISATTAMR